MYSQELTNIFWRFVNLIFLLSCCRYPRVWPDWICSSLISPATIKRLMSAVSFGYGIFHLAVSLLPPKLLNVIHFLVTMLWLLFQKARAFYWKSHFYSLLKIDLVFCNGWPIILLTLGLWGWPANWDSSSPLCQTGKWHERSFGNVSLIWKLYITVKATLCDHS